MIAVLCLDNNNGMMFNNRRLSRDKTLVYDLIHKVSSSGGRLLMNEYSSQLFPDSNNIIISQNFLDEAKENDYCFVENNNLEPYVNKIIAIIVYRWNRDYPSDKKLDIDLETKFHLEQSNDFVGNSHERITCEVYVK